MAAMNLRRAGVVLVTGALAIAASLSEVRAQEPTIEPDAASILKRMTDYLGGLQQFSLDADNMIEDVYDTGQKIQYDFAASIKIQRPDRLRVDRGGEDLSQAFVYDGKTLMMYNPMEGFFAKTAAPDNLDDLLHFARETLDIVPPTGDMVFTNAYDLLMAGVTSGGVVGKAIIDGVSCDHLAFRTPVVDWQIWIADGDEPLPLKYLLTTMDDPAHPQYLVLMSNWNTAPDFDESQFAFTPPADAQEIDFLRMDMGREPGD